jgi:hypothetical protein
MMMDDDMTEQAPCRLLRQLVSVTEHHRYEESVFDAFFSCFGSKRHSAHAGPNVMFIGSPRFPHAVSVRIENLAHHVYLYPLYSEWMCRRMPSAACSFIVLHFANATDRCSFMAQNAYACTRYTTDEWFAFLCGRIDAVWRK